MLLSPLFTNYNSNARTYSHFNNIHVYGPYNMKESTKNGLCEILLKLQKINFNFDNDYYHLVNKVTPIQIAFIGHVGTLERKRMLLTFLEETGNANDKNKVLLLVKSIIKFIQSHGVFYGNLSEEVKSAEVAKLLSTFNNMSALLNEQVTNLLYFITDLVTSADLIKDNLEFLETALSSLHQSIGEKDLTKRMILSLGICFVQQLIDNLTINVE